MLNASVLLSRGTITSPPGEAGSGDSLPILHRTQSDPIPRLETGQSHFKQKAKINTILIYEL